jgi:hypothetical protein
LNQFPLKNRKLQGKLSPSQKLEANDFILNDKVRQLAQDALKEIEQKYGF